LLRLRDRVEQGQRLEDVSEGAEPLCERERLAQLGRLAPWLEVRIAEPREPRVAAREEKVLEGDIERPERVRDARIAPVEDPQPAVAPVNVGAV